MFTGRYTVQSGRRVLNVRRKRPAYEAIQAAHQDNPVALLHDGRRTLWHYHDCFYWEDEGLDNEDVKATRPPARAAVTAEAPDRAKPDARR
jgi:hypothetical protein